MSAHPCRSTRLPPVRAALLVALAILCVRGPVGAADAEPNGATIQWAQIFLDEKGFYQGRASGRMDATTAAAIAAYQKKAGLPATGRLDAATIERIKADKGDKQDPTVGNLADPGKRAKASQPFLKEEVKPLAAPSAASVERGEGQEHGLLSPSRGPAPGALPGAAAGQQPPPDSATPPAPPPHSPPASAGVSRMVPSEPGSATAPASAPAAAPRAGVQAEGTDRAASSLLDLDGETGDLLRYGLLAGTGLLVLGLLVIWVLSGRKPRRSAGRSVPTPAPGGFRREPTLGRQEPAGRGRPGLSVPPRQRPHG